MKRYAIAVEDAGTNLAAYVPDLPGCVATGRSPEELAKRIRAAVVMHLEGMAIPEPTSRVDYIEIH